MGSLSSDQDQCKKKKNQNENKNMVFFFFFSYCFFTCRGNFTIANKDALLYAYASKEEQNIPNKNISYNFSVNTNFFFFFFFLQFLCPSLLALLRF